MYKKIILSLMLLPLFSSNESLCIDTETVIVGVAVAVGTGITIAVTSEARTPA